MNFYWVYNLHERSSFIELADVYKAMRSINFKFEFISNRYLFELSDDELVEDLKYTEIGT